MCVLNYTSSDGRMHVVGTAQLVATPADYYAHKRNCVQLSPKNLPQVRPRNPHADRRVAYIPS